MSEFKKVKIQSIIESQIPEFLNADYPLFKEFLQQYYVSQEYQTGSVDLSKNLNKYKSIDNFNNETFYSSQYPPVLTSDVLAFDDTINVSHTIGFPDSYGLFKIDDEIITYTGKTINSFTGCIRGFSGIDNLDKTGNTQFLEFLSTQAETHFANTEITNLNLIFFQKLFNKFKSQFLPGFENRQLYPKLNLETLLSRAKDFYISKGTDISFQILFSVLFGEQIQIIKPKDYTLKPSTNNYFLTKNILVEKISGGNIENIKGKNIFQSIAGVGTASASVYNVEYRPTGKKDFYEISLDSTSLIYDFNITKKTNVLENVSIGSSSIFVDSTVGFGNSGTFFVFPSNYSGSLELSYTDKNINQFIGVTGITNNLSFGDKIVENNFLYSYLDDGSIIQMRLLNVINNVDYSKTSRIRVGDKISLSEFGVNLSDKIQTNSWIYNIPTKHEIQSITEPFGSNSLVTITLKDNVKFVFGEKIYLINSNNQDDIPLLVQVEKIISTNTIQIQTTSNISGKNIVSKIINKTNLLNGVFPEIKNLEAGVQNTYSDYYFNNFYVASSGIPNYGISSNINVVKLLSLSADGYTIRTQTRHQFLTGERVYFHSTNQSQNYLKSGKYFVRKINDIEINLSFNQSDLFSGVYIDFSKYNKLSFSSNEFLIKDGFYDKNLYGQNKGGIKKLKHQKLFKKFNISKTDKLNSFDTDKSTKGYPVGLLINGVEIYPPTVLNESIFYGNLININVQRKGNGYDIINGPKISITDPAGTGIDAKGIANVTGSVKEVKIISPGIGYKQKPKITIEGGNGSGAILEPNLIKQRITSSFKGNTNGVDINNDIITFIDNHNFENAEEIIYNSNGNVPIICRESFTINNVLTNKNFFLSDNSSYFVGIVSSNQINLYKSYKDSISGINTVNIIGISSGIHNFQTLNSKNTINKIYVKNPGSGYSNKSIRTTSGINTHDNYIQANGHNFLNGDIVNYSYTTSSIGGLSTETQYIVTTIDENRFKLSEAGIGTQFTKERYINKEYVDLHSSGIGTHTFAYPKIEIKIQVVPGISQTSIVSPVLEPIVLGSIDSVFLEDPGVGYGTSEIINFHRKPLVTILQPSSTALLKPIISNTSIIDVQILNSGNGYENDIDVVISGGNGKYADILPIVENGKITSLKILNPGIGYNKNTKIEIQKRGSGAEFEGNVFEWNINQVVKNKPLYANDDNFIIPSENKSLGLKFINFYAPKELRKQLDDNIDSTLKESNQNKQSPIVGWAYDGNPIYGPYIIDGSSYRKVKSSYSTPTSLDYSIRPKNFPPGYFIQDYPFNREYGDLDEFNGKFIKNNDFPDGIYAYFCTLDDFDNPAYPYVIGNNFKDNPIKDNFNSGFNQDSNLQNIDIIRNNGPYYINSLTSRYDLIDKVQSNYKQDFIVKKTYPAGITSVTVYSSGFGYKVNDVLVFDNENTGGTSASAIVERVLGKNISSIQIGISTFTNVSVYNKSNTIFVDTKIPHNLLNEDVVLVSSISDVNFSSLNGFKKILVNNKTVGITTDILSTSITGVSTYISVNDISGFKVNDLIEIDDEIVRIVEISAQQSKFRIIRSQAYSGVHKAGISSVKLLPTEFNFIVDELKSYSVNNFITYFDPYSSVGYGTQGTTYTEFSGKDRYISERRIYVPNHNFYTGQPLTYASGINGNPIKVSNTGIGVSFYLEDPQTVYSVVFDKDYIGISTLGFTTSIGIGSSLNSLYFMYDQNIGVAHSLTTQFNPITGKIENYSATITTPDPHELLNDQNIKFNLFPSLTQTIAFRYDENLRKITSPFINFDSTNNGVDLNTSEIEITDNELNTGDKVVYYSNGNNPIGGLQDNEKYFILRLNPDKIKLCKYEYDTKIGNYIQLTSVSIGNHSLSLINPEITVTKGNQIVFNLTDFTLNNFKLILYRDKNFTRELESYFYPNYTLDTQNSLIPSEIYYKFEPTINAVQTEKEISYDDEVKNRNKISIKPSLYNREYSILTIDDNNFKITLPVKPETTGYTVTSGINSVFYDTNSITSSGPISKINLISGGKGYLKLPKISSVTSSNGKGAVLFANSSSVGKIDYLERVKDGFDYPTDKTLKPYLSVPATAQIKDISRVDFIGIITGGKRYNVPPILKVIGNNNIKLSCSIIGGSVNNVSIVKNTNDLSVPLNIIPTRNSNGYDINAIDVNGNYVTLELINVDVQLYPLIPDVYGQSVSTFPFEVGDQIFIERCIIKNKNQTNYNSSNHKYTFFTITSVDTNNYTITYDISGLNINQEQTPFGEYDLTFGYGYVVNRKDMAQFEMFIIDDLSYTSNEKVLGYDLKNNNVFNATVMENGWDNDINELRMINCSGELKEGYKLKGTLSKLNGTVIRVNQFNLESKIGNSRDKINYSKDRKGILNDYQQRISDNSYYQKFSYSIKGKVPYSKWKEPVRSLVHPAGYVEFSDLDVIGITTSGPVEIGIAKSTNMKPISKSDLTLVIEIDNKISLQTKHNFALAKDEYQEDDGSVERVEVTGADLTPYILAKTNKVILIDDISNQFNGISTSAQGGQIVGLTSFRLKSTNGIDTYPLFYKEFDSSNGITTTIYLGSNIFKIPNHNFQTGQNIIYSYGDGTPIGIATTSVVESSQVIKVISGNTAYLSVASTASNILMEVGGGVVGGAIYENGYNSQINAIVSGISSVDLTHASKNVFYGYGHPFPQKYTSGIGIDAKFSVFIVYDNTGTPISTSVILNNGGRGYSIGDNVSISGTYMGGATPQNDLSFQVSQISNSTIPGQANQTYQNLSATTIVGVGAGASFTVSRDSFGIINSVIVIKGGVGYALTDQIVISGSDVGGVSPLDNVYLSPTVLGTNILPQNLYVKKIDDNKFKVSGLSTTVDNSLDLVALGIGTHSFALANPNENSFIVIDNIFQTPPYYRGLYPELSQSVGIGSTQIYINSGISSISGIDFVKIDNEYLKIKSIGIGSTNVLEVERGYLGTTPEDHTSTNQVAIMRGDYNIINDVLYFSTAPYGKIPYLDASTSTAGVTTTLNAKSSFQGRVFSREFDFVQASNDKNIILDDISLQFTGLDNVVGTYTGTFKSQFKDTISGINTSLLLIGDVINLVNTNNLLINSDTIVSEIGNNLVKIQPNHNVSSGVGTTSVIITRTNYPLTTNNENVVGIFTNTNSIIDSNNNPLIFINNILQFSGKDFIIDTPGNNTIKFISGIPKTGRISRVSITTSYGYQPLVGASATVSVSPTGTINNIYLTGYGSGYRTPPVVTIASTIGSGAIISADLGLGGGGELGYLSIDNPGSGYTNTSIPEVIISLPSAYGNLSLYQKDGIGVGTDAKIDVQVGNGSSIIQFDITNPGTGYKVGDVLGVTGIVTNPTVGIGFSEFVITVTEVLSDKFFGYYPGEFIQFNDISPFFNGYRKTFSLTVTENNKTSVISLKTLPGSDLNINNNILIYLNNILQEPGVSYNFKNSRIVFTEAPKPNSNCVILFYKGSVRDVLEVVPPPTIKEGDTIQINKDLYQPLVKGQFERVVKKIISVDELDTFTYDSIGIDTTTNRALDWTKQTEDKIINGVLYSKSRPGLHSKVTPTAQIIKKVLPSDTKIYVDNCFPIFSYVDSISYQNDNIFIVENENIAPAFGTAYVSSASTISNILISYGGVGYKNILSPSVQISNSSLLEKDLVYSWKQTSGITTISSLNSLVYGNVFVLVGDDGVICDSQEGINWNFNKYGLNNLNSVDVGGPTGISEEFIYLSVGNNSTVVKSVGIGTTVSSWNNLTLYDIQSNFNELKYVPTTYTDNLNSVVYSNYFDSWVSVGNNGAVFYGAGITTSSLLNYSPSIINQNLLSVTSNENKFVAVGKSGTILYSRDGKIWNKSVNIIFNNFTTNDLYKVIWAEGLFIAVGDNLTILTSPTGENDWTLNNIDGVSGNLRNIKYYNNHYYLSDSLGKFYQSNDLNYWIPINTNQLNQINDFEYYSGLDYQQKIVAVGLSGTCIYSEPSFHYPSFTSNIQNESIVSIDINDGGFGYKVNSEIPFFVQSDTAKVETVYTVRTKGDFGNITKISVASSTIDFTLKSQQYDNTLLGIGYSSLNSYGINYSQLNVGDYFIITESNSTCGHALTGITTSIGGLSNYPESKIGTAKSFIDGVYRVERVQTDIISGIVTVGCNFTPGPSGYPIDVNVGVTSLGFYGKYSWGVFYGYQNRQNRNPQTFDLNVDNGIVGLSTAPVVSRTFGLI
jgi:hypothetical protein